MNVGLTILLFIPGILISLYIGYYTWNLNALGSRLFSGFSVSLSIWLIASAMELSLPPSLLDTIFIQIHLIGIVLTTLFLFLFSVRYGTGYSFSSRQLVLLNLVPCISILMILLNPLFGLFWTDVTPVIQNSVNFSKLSYGPFLVLQSAYSYILVILSSGIFLRLLFHRRSMFTKQSIAIISAVLLPVSVNVAYSLNLLPIILFDPTALTITFTQVIFVLALYQTDFYSVVPGVQNIGWSYISDTIEVGVCIVDVDKTIVEYNTWFDKEFVGSDNTNLIKSNIIGSDIDSFFNEIDSEVSDGEFTKKIIQNKTDFYRISKEELYDNNDDCVGFVYTIQKVTMELQSQQQIRLLNRFLRHNLRNSLSVIQLGVERMKTVTPEDKSKEKEIVDTMSRVENNIQKLISASEVAKNVENSISTSQTRTVPLETIVYSAVENIESRFDTQSTTNIVVNVGKETVKVTENFEIAIEQIIENSIKHAQSDSLSININSTVTDFGYVRLTIQDNGIGIPTDAVQSFETEISESPEENQLYHGVGLGFGIAHWLSIQSGGKFNINSDDTIDGASVEFKLQKVD